MCAPWKILPALALVNIILTVNIVVILGNYALDYNLKTSINYSKNSSMHQIGSPICVRVYVISLRRSHRSQWLLTRFASLTPTLMLIPYTFIVP